ncbi:MAG: hypothetical protein LUG51_03995 [Tannerellaceae bacterium]|nr:hypothetical protein [Tannerellaceae bacterium]
MKKNLWYILLVVFSMNLFVACGDDEDDPTPNPTPDGIEWKDVTGEYSGGSIAINGAKVTDSYRAIKLSENTLGNAIIVLKNVVPENPEITFEDVEMKESGSTYTFTAQTTDEATGTVISITNGTLTPDALTKATESSSVGIAVTVTRKLTADVVGDWTLKLQAPDFGVMANIVLPDPAANAMIAQLPPMIGQLIASKVAAVNIALGEDGSFDVNWTTVAGEVAGIPESVYSLIELSYLTEGDVFYMALGKTAMGQDAKALLMVMASAFLTEEVADTLFDSLLIDRGGYYLLPLNYKVEAGEAIFYLAKDMIVDLLPVLTPLLQGLIPAEYAGMFGPVLQALPYADPLEFGLVFTK